MLSKKIISFLTLTAVSVSLGLFAGLRPLAIRAQGFIAEAGRRALGLDAGMALLGRLLGTGLGALSAGAERVLFSKVPDSLAGAWSWVSGSLARVYAGLVQGYAWIMAASVFVLILILGLELP